TKACSVSTLASRMTAINMPPLNLKLFFFQAEDGIRDYKVTGVQTCALPISLFFVLLRLGNDRRVLGTHTNGAPSNVVGWGAVLLTLALAILTLRQLIGGH